MGVTVQQKALNPATPVSIISSSSTVANGSNAISSGIDFSQSNASIAGYSRGRWIFSGTFGAAPSANTALVVYQLPSTDGGTTYTTDLGRSTTPVSAPIATIPLDATNPTQTQMSASADLPDLNCKIILVNNSGQAISASAWTLTLIPETDQGN